jgi:RNA polymerase sigma-70 factor (sigma-E family)
MTITQPRSAGVDFESYVRDAGRPLLRFAIVLTDDPELAQDLVQDVLLRAQQNWARIGEVERPHAYVRRMIVNEMVSWRRKWSRIEPRPDRDLDHVVADPTDAVDRRDALLTELARLPVKQRAAIVLRYLEDMTDADIGEVLGCTPGTVRVHVHRALARLRVDLGSSAIATESHA